MHGDEHPMRLSPSPPGVGSRVQGLNQERKLKSALRFQITGTFVPERQPAGRELIGASMLVDLNELRYGYLPVVAIGSEQSDATGADILDAPPFRFPGKEIASLDNHPDLLTLDPRSLDAMASAIAATIRSSFPYRHPVTLSNREFAEMFELDPI
jgi:hypothetical protein